MAPALAVVNLILVMIGLATCQVTLGGLEGGAAKPALFVQVLIGGCALALVVSTWKRCARASRSMPMGEQAHGEESAVLLSAVLDAAVDGVVIIDDHGQIELFNGAAERMFGYSQEEVIGSNVRMLMPESVASVHDGYLRKFRESGAQNVLGLAREVLARRKDGSLFPMSLAANPAEAGGRVRIAGLLRDLTYEKKRQARVRLRAAALSAAADGIIITDRAGIIQWVNPAFCKHSGYAIEELVGQPTRMLKSGEHDPEFYSQLWATVTAGDTWQGEIVNRYKDGSLHTEEMTITPVLDEEGKIEHFVAIKRDVTARHQEREQRVMLEAQLVQAQKLEAVGQLAAGIAHEINTPTQYVGDNTRFLQEAFSELLPLLASVGRIQGGQDASDATPDPLEALRDQFEEIDCEYLQHEIPRAIQQSLDGIERVATIVKAMKEFSHPGVAEFTNVDINHAIESTSIVARNEWKYVADMQFDLEPDLPTIPCMAGELNQVVLNLIVNAAHAIGGVVGDTGEEKGVITLATRRVDDCVEISVRDTGTGIPESARSKVFDPFFTTKGVGRGTGQGLAIAHDVVVNKHGGSIAFETELGVGTVFKVCLPLVRGETPEELATP